MISEDSSSVSWVDDLKLGIANVLDTAQQRVVIVCPYVDLDEVESIGKRLHAALERGVETTLFVRDEPKQVEGALGSFADALRQQNLNYLAVKNLHAKIYLSETRMIVSSINLRESSFKHGLEIGFNVSPGPLYDRVRDFIEMKLIDGARVIFGKKPNLHATFLSQNTVTGRKPSLKTAEASRPKATAGDANQTKGHCIRCAAEIPVDILHPFCRKDEKTWAKYGDADYPESYCVGRRRARRKQNRSAALATRSIARSSARVDHSRLPAPPTQNESRPSCSRNARPSTTQAHSRSVRARALIPSAARAPGARRASSTAR